MLEDNGGYDNTELSTIGEGVIITDGKSKSNGPLQLGNSLNDEA